MLFLVLHSTGFNIKKIAITVSVYLVFTFFCSAEINIRNGTLFENSQLKLITTGVEAVGIIPGSGSAIKIEVQSSGSFFSSEHNAIEVLLIAIPDFPENTTKIKLPDKNIRFYYQAGSQFPVFKVTRAEGQVDFVIVDDKLKIASGTMRCTSK